MSDDCLNIFLQKHQIPFEGTYVSGFDTITREQLAKRFSTILLGEFYVRSFEEQKLLLITLKQIRHSFSSDFTQELRSKYLHASFFDRDKYMEELYKVTLTGLHHSPIGKYGYLELIHLKLRNLEPRQYAEHGWFRSMMFDFYDCMFKIIIHSPAPDAVVDKKTEISTPDKNNDDDDLKLGKQFDYDKKTEISRPHKREILSPDKNNDEKSFEKMSYIDHLLRRYGLQYNKNRDYKQENPTKNTDSKKGGNKKTKNKQKTNKKNKKTKRKY